MALNDYETECLETRFKRNLKNRGRWFQIQWRKRTLSPPIVLMRLILLDERLLCCHMTSIRCQKRMNNLIVECLLGRRMRDTWLCGLNDT
ncbi:uncharacterized protein DS421_13g424730 [Arachis hypogaea]|nr:uncharacterized protein DS421_13g424730 [Arachis hypogaea]